MGQLLDRIGVPVYRAACQNIFDQSCRMDHAAISAIAVGTWTRFGHLDDDGTGKTPIRVEMTLTIKGDALTVDLTGSSGPVPGSVNCGAKQTESLLRLAYKTMINPDRAITGGSFETMTVVVPDSCMFNAQEPLAREWYFTGLGLLADLLTSCMSEAILERSTAAHLGDSRMAGFFSVDKARGQRIALEPDASRGECGGAVTGVGERARRRADAPVPRQTDVGLCNRQH